MYGLQLFYEFPSRTWDLFVIRHIYVVSTWEESPTLGKVISLVMAFYEHI